MHDTHATDLLGESLARKRREKVYTASKTLQDSIYPVGFVYTRVGIYKMDEEVASHRSMSEALRTFAAVCDRSRPIICTQSSSRIIMECRQTYVSRAVFAVYCVLNDGSIVRQFVYIW